LSSSLSVIAILSLPSSDEGATTSDNDRSDDAGTQPVGASS
jgi:hypothetical protein